MASPNIKNTTKINKRFCCILSFLYKSDTYQGVSNAVMAGKGLPSTNSKNAPPPVDR
ncbi:hypothetical protein [Moraxella lacunata]|uniref:hypothetical protein n=1 Tax=Moraxella lacunata TaxID=477 RepID=UPI003EE0F709